LRPIAIMAWKPFLLPSWLSSVFSPTRPSSFSDKIGSTLSRTHRPLPSPLCAAQIVAEHISPVTPG
jgi:hypothetical protein